jgi:hypothetical protein
MPLTAILYGTKIIKSQANCLDKLSSELESKNIKVILAENLNNLESFVAELDQADATLVENSFAIFDTTSKPKLLDYKNDINQKINWIETFIQFADNYSNSKPEGNYWRWGQVVQETGEYLCQNCGFIEEFKQGEIFRVCESCKAGEPEGACSPSEGYWEKL